MRAHAPFRIDVWVVPPDHLHCLWTLPDDDADISGRWRVIKIAVSKSLRLGVDCRAETCKRTGKRWVGLLDLRLRPLLVGPGRRVILSVFHSVSRMFSFALRKLMACAASPCVAMTDMQVFARERRRFSEALVDPLSAPSGNPYIECEQIRNKVIC